MSDEFIYTFWFSPPLGGYPMTDDLISMSVNERRENSLTGPVISPGEVYNGSTFAIDDNIAAI